MKPLNALRLLIRRGGVCHILFCFILNVRLPTAYTFFFSALYITAHVDSMMQVDTNKSCVKRGKRMCCGDAHDMINK